MSGLPRGWEATAGSELFDLVRGVSYEKNSVRDQPGPGLTAVLRANNIEAGELNRKDLIFVPNRFVAQQQLLQESDLLIASSSGSRAVVGKAAPATPAFADVAFGAFCTVVRPALPELANWLRYFFKTDNYRSFVESVALGININNLRNSDLAILPIFVAPLAEQRRIVAKLDALTARTARARADIDRIPNLADRYRVALLRAGMRGELTRQWRTVHSPEPAAQTVSKTAQPPATRGGRDATSEFIPGQAALSVNLPQNEPPAGWYWVSLRRIARQETGHTPSRGVDSYWNGGVPWIGIRDAGAHHGKVVQQTLQTISAEGLANSSARLLPKGTVCLSRTASVGYVTIMGTDMATSQDFATWTCTDALMPEYLMYALMAEGDDIRAFGKGTTHTTIYFPEIRALHICLAPLDEQAEIVRLIKAGLAEIDRLAAEAAAARKLLDRLDQAILAKAFRGELVPQDPDDEPASVLLDRIRAERAAAPKAKRGRKPRAA